MVDRTYRLSGGPGDFRPTRGQGEGGWCDRSHKLALTCLIRVLKNHHNILLRVKMLKPHI
jgi:hypothetical protein